MVSVVNFHPGELESVIAADRPRIITNPAVPNVVQILPFALAFFSWSKPTVKHIDIKTIPAPEIRIYLPEIPES